MAAVRRVDSGGRGRVRVRDVVGDGKTARLVADVAHDQVLVEDLPGPGET
ncbi:hypothetical protein OIE69_44390 (plasmid) [Actinacidiphila glaucinigra]|nr:hypothetical protein [Actinacidiphila glaucinigra]WSD65767.1 hypothetical protein OIE69_43460 [Actinacidiphila glaucinigra]WSD65945.1 hypothetical protein OIE69_44390 [Actinacidiphila glaucinigra]